ncbi:winged helix-turn-helix transcriptional regulator [Halorarius litoreus]|uniref:winged helix-turn-helix transcriptional regulator n=1 Tax=Halorarius litoreus TaxID=2962676 RepID=UPI0020CC53F1|nr:helix-turn-helix domain-containing protein [Halorarius litoreus]
MTNTTDATPTPTPSGSSTDSSSTDGSLTDTTDSTLSDAGDTTDSTLSDAGDTTDSTLSDAGDTTDSILSDTGDSTTTTDDGTVLAAVGENTTDAVAGAGSALTNSTTDAGATLTNGTKTAGSELTDGVEGSLTAATTSLTDAALLDDATLAEDSTFSVSDPSASGTDDSVQFEPYETPAGDESLDAAAAPEVAAASTSAGSRQLPTGPGPMAAGATAVAGLGALAAGTMLGSGTGIERTVTSRVAGALDRLVRMVAPFRYSRYDGSDPLEHEDRAAIHDYVTENPGAYMSAVSENVGVNHSTARHHVKVLEREGVIENAKVRGRRRLFPAHAQQQELAAAMADEATADVLEAIARLGPCSGSALAEEVGKSVSTVSHHLSRLEDDDLVVREKDGRATVNRLPSEVQEALAPDREPAGADSAAVSAD